VDEVEVSTVVYLPPEEVYEFIVDFPGYANYSEHIRRVRRDGDGAPGTRYFITFAWWKLAYTARARVVDTDPPERVDWEITRDIDAEGAWIVEPAPDEAADEGERPAASRVRFRVGFRPESVGSDVLDLPRFVSLDWVIDRVKPLVREEAERIVRRIVADLEGERRDVHIEVHATPDSV
jgi:uncharacterized membrane protein